MTLPSSPQCHHNIIYRHSPGPGAFVFEMIAHLLCRSGLPQIWLYKVRINHQMNNNGIIINGEWRAWNSGRPHQRIWCIVPLELGNYRTSTNRLWQYWPSCTPPKEILWKISHSFISWVHCKLTKGPLYWHCSHIVHCHNVHTHRVFRVLLRTCIRAGASCHWSTYLTFFGLISILWWSFIFLLSNKFWWYLKEQQQFRTGHLTLVEYRV